MRHGEWVPLPAVFVDDETRTGGWASSFVVWASRRDRSTPLVHGLGVHCVRHEHEGSLVPFRKAVTTFDETISKRSGGGVIEKRRFASVGGGPGRGGGSGVTGTNAKRLPDRDTDSALDRKQNMCAGAGTHTQGHPQRTQDGQHTKSRARLLHLLLVGR